MPKTFEDLMRRADPAAGVAPLDDLRRSAIIDHAMTRPEAIQHRPRHVRWFAAAAALVLVVAGTSWQLLGPTTSEARADEVLREAAIHAVDPEIVAGQYWEITSRSVEAMGIESTTGTHSYLVETVTVDYVEVEGLAPTWHDKRPSTPIKQVAGPKAEFEEVYQGRPEDAWTSNLIPAELGFSLGNPQAPTWVDSLPTDPTELHAALLEHSPQAPDAATQTREVFDLAKAVLTSGLADAPLRSALFEMLRDLPAVHVSDDAATLDGRAGVGIALEGVELGSEIIIDPRVGEVIGSRMHIPAEWSHFDEPYVTETSVTRRLVNQIPAELRERAVHFNCVEQNKGQMQCRS